MHLAVWLVLSCFAVANADICSIIHYSANQWDADCADKNLTALPDYSDRPVVYLNLRNANLTSNITFKGWTHLKYVDLSFNKLYDVGNATFEGFNELGSLNVSYCSLKNITSSHLKGKTLIKHLDLSGNDLLPLSADFLQTLNKSLDRGSYNIFINNMGIRNFTPDFFVSALSLQRLHMRDNLLSNLPVFPPNLNYLDISNNSLTVLHSEPFKLSTNLVTLIAENNVELIDINEEAFKYLLNLTVLSLKGNRKLEYLPNGLFFHNSNLKKLSLAECNFKTLTPYFNPAFLNLKHLELHGNPWECNQSIKWFKSLDPSAVALSSIRCQNGLTFTEQFAKSKLTVMRNVIISLVVMTFSFFAIGACYIYDLEKKRRAANPYWRLGRKNPLSDPVYISTVV